MSTQYTGLGIARCSLLRFPHATGAVEDMKTLKTIAAVQRVLKSARIAGEKIAFVPTMGYLHEGHATLIRRAARLAPHVVVSIFVNPLQFGPSEDFARYPRDLARDTRIAREAGATVLFVPEASEITPASLLVTVDPGPLADTLCGASRPGHFRGVCTIVNKLFNIVRPDMALFGWKDAQQLLILRKMVADLNQAVKIVGVETVREADGLAMSSRNSYLSPQERAEAPRIQQALTWARTKALSGSSPAVLHRELKKRIGAISGARIDYVEIVGVNDLRPLKRVVRGNTMIAAAVFVGKTRLIDNVRF